MRFLSIRPVHKIYQHIKVRVYSYIYIVILCNIHHTGRGGSSDSLRGRAPSPA